MKQQFQISKDIRRDFKDFGNSGTQTLKRSKNANFSLVSMVFRLSTAARSVLFMTFRLGLVGEEVIKTRYRVYRNKKVTQTLYFTRERTGRLQLLLAEFHSSPT